MKNSLYYTLFFILSFLFINPSVNAEQTEEIEFDIYKKNDSLTTWLDLSPFITAKRVQQLKNGIELMVQIKINLIHPKRLWGYETIKRVNKSLKIGYRIVTEEYTAVIYQDKTETSHQFLSMGKLHQFLTDSIAVTICVIDSLESGKYYTLEYDFSYISLTTINLIFDDKQTEESDSPVKYLFKQFLHLTDFGREKSHQESRPFSKSEIISRD